MQIVLLVFIIPILSVFGDFQCPQYTVYNTNDATEYYATCTFSVCQNEIVTFSMCGNGACDGDTVIRLYDNLGAQVASNDDSCDICSQILDYQVTTSGCQEYSLHEGCYGYNACQGTVTVTGAAATTYISSTPGNEAIDDDAITHGNSSSSGCSDVASCYADSYDHGNDFVLCDMCACQYLNDCDDEDDKVYNCFVKSHGEDMNKSQCETRMKMSWVIGLSVVGGFCFCLCCCTCAKNAFKSKSSTSSYTPRSSTSQPLYTEQAPWSTPTTTYPKTIPAPPRPAATYPPPRPPTTHSTPAPPVSRYEPPARGNGNSNRRIDIAAAAMSQFLKAMMGSKDRCSVVAFNSTYQPVLLLGNERQTLDALQLCRNKCDGDTFLYDSIVMSVAQFLVTADGTRPWILIVLTDGVDNGSGRSLKEAAESLVLFNALPTSYVFVIGIGSEVETNGALTTLCDLSGSLYLHANDSQALEMIFPLIALKVCIPDHIMSLLVC
jgi:hypothetical protein